MKKNASIAILQIISNHHQKVPIEFIRALATLDKSDYPYNLYDINHSQEYNFRTGLIKLFHSIKEEIILVSMSCHNNYPKIEALIFLYLYRTLLKDKKVIICSPYFSLYEISLLQQDNIIFSFLNIDEYITKELGVSPLDEEFFLNNIEVFLSRYGYQEYRLWSYLTFGCYSQCSFCYNRLHFKRAPTLTYYSPDTALSWMRVAKQLGKTYFEFCEPNFLSDREYAMTFLQRLQHENLGVSWRCKARLDEIDESIYEQMVKAGCQTIFFGFEHMDLKLLQRIRKGENSFKKLKEFMRYRQGSTNLQFSFMTGIRGETSAALRRNLDMITYLASISGIEPNIGWQILFNKKKERKKLYRNYVIAFMYIMNIVPYRKEVSPKLMHDILRMCIKNPFFDFLYVTESESSLDLMHQLFGYLQSRPHLNIIEDYYRLLSFDNGALIRLIFSNHNLDTLNQKILSLVGM